jgi:DNA-binding response OmpR family regulator
MDYYLSEGDGLDCLRKLRATDAVVPIIAVSRVATREIAGQLITAGADDCLNKMSITRLVLGQSIRNVLTRAQAIRARTNGAAAIPASVSCFRRAWWENSYVVRERRTGWLFRSLAYHSI